MFYVFVGLMIGLMIPYMARRFAKFMPATFAGALVEMFRPGIKVKGYYRLKLYRQFLYRSISSGLVTAGLTGIAYWHFGGNGFYLIACFLWILLLAAEVDYRTFFLADILTVPLLILGFVATAFGYGFVNVYESAWGAVVGYFLPIVVSLLIVVWKKDAFGGGDIKLLAALGAWLGVVALLKVIVLASVLGIIYAWVCRQRMIAFGPMIVLSGIIVAFCLF